MRSSSARGPPTTASPWRWRRIAECIVKDERSVLPVSVVLEGEYGLEDLCLSIPSIVGQDGVEKVLEIPLAPREKSALLSSAQQLQEVIGHLELPLKQKSPWLSRGISCAIWAAPRPPPGQ